MTENNKFLSQKGFTQLLNSLKKEFTEVRQEIASSSGGSNGPVFYEMEVQLQGNKMTGTVPDSFLNLFKLLNEQKRTFVIYAKLFAGQQDTQMRAWLIPSAGSVGNNIVLFGVGFLTYDLLYPNVNTPGTELAALTGLISSDSSLKVNLIPIENNFLFQKSTVKPPAGTSDSIITFVTG